LADDDVGSPARSCSQCEQQAERGYRAAAERQQCDAGRGHRRPGEVAWPARTSDRDAQGADELDRDRDPQGDARNRLVEAQVHPSDDQAEKNDRPPLPGVESRPSRARDRQQDAGPKRDPHEHRAGRTKKGEQVPGDGRPHLDRRDRAERVGDASRRLHLTGCCAGTIGIPADAATTSDCDAV